MTSILSPLSDFSFVSPDVLEAASAFGTAVHLACELWDKGDLDEVELDPALVPYLAGWKQFSEDWKVEWTMVEERVFQPTHRYAGTLDRFGTVTSPLSGDCTTAVVDIKSSVALYPSVGPQLSAYKEAILESTNKTQRIAVQLKADGSYVAKTYTDRDDWPMFLSLLTLKNWCDRHSITPNFKKRK